MSIKIEYENLISLPDKGNNSEIKRNNSEIIISFNERVQELNLATRSLTSGKNLSDKPNQDISQIFTVELQNYQAAETQVLLELFSSSLSNGLTESQRCIQFKNYGPNVIPKPTPIPMWVKFLLSFTSGFAPMLWIVSIILIISWEPFCPQCVANLIEAILLIAIILGTGVFSFYQEVEGEKVLSAFESLLSYDAKVKRDGTIIQIPSNEIVAGDIIYLATGDRIPADVRILEAIGGLSIDKSMLTGESEPVKLTSKPVDDLTVTMLVANNIAFMGCTVIDGEGFGIVVATGANTQLAYIANQVSRVDTKLSTLQKEINYFVALIFTVASIMTITVICVWAGYLNEQHKGFMTPFEMIANAIGVLVALVPQGLPLSLNLGLSLVAKKLFKKSVLVKKMTTIETLGCISFLASDKTGTLTQNKMTVTNSLFADKTILQANEMSSENNIQQIPRSLYQVAYFCNQSKLNLATKEIVGGNGVDVALMNWIVTQSDDILNSTITRSKVVFTIPFSSKTKFSVTLIETEGVYQVLMKGAPEYVANRCTSFYSFKENNIVISPKESHGDPLFIHDLKESIETVSSQGQRVIGIAALTLKPEQIPLKSEFVAEPTPNFPLEELTFICAIGVSDPPKVDVDKAIAELRNAGIQVAMVTGDAPSTAQAIAKQVGIISADSIITKYDGVVKQLEANNDNVDEEMQLHPFGNRRRAIVVEGYYIDGLTDEHWKYILSHDEFVFARTTPDHKLLIVSEQQKRNRIVGVTGDGTNDAPALKRADIGLAMFSGSSVATDAAAVILLTNDFNAVPIAVEQGRLLFVNLQNAIAYMIAAGCWSELMPVLSTFFLGIPTPLSSLMCIAICVLSDTVAGIALMCEAPERALMLDKPRQKDQHLVTIRLLVYSYLFMGNIQAIAGFYNYFLYMYDRGPTHETRTPLPVDDDSTQSYSSLNYPLGYTPYQLIGAWNWLGGTGDLATDEASAAATGSSVFYTTLVVCQMGHLISIRRRTPYFSDAILNTAKSNDSIGVRLWKELLNSSPPLPIVLSICFSFAIANFWNETPGIQNACGTDSVDGKYWGIAIGFAGVCFICSELRKWLILLLPEKYSKFIAF